MTPTEAAARYLKSAAGCRLVLLDDYQGLLEPPAAWPGPEGPWQVIAARGNLEFRLRYEPLRDSGARLVVVRQRPDLFLPDVEALADRHCPLTPRRILEWVTAPGLWPDWVDHEDELVRSRLGGIVRAWRASRPAALTTPEAEALLLRGAVGLDVDQSSDPAEAWRAVFEHERLLRKLRKQSSPLARRLQHWLRQQPAPVRWLNLDSPGAAVRLTWLVALLQPHLPDIIADLPRLYPGAQPLDGEDATAVARVAYRLERVAPELAAAQRDEGEAVLAGPLREAMVKLLRLEEPADAARVIRREPRSGHLVVMALRSLLAAVAADAVPHELGLEPELEQLARRAESYSHAACVRTHALLLRALLRLDRARLRLAALADCSGPQLLGRLSRLWQGTALAQVEQDLATAREGLCDNAFLESIWDAVPRPERHKAIAAALFHGVQMTAGAVGELEQRVAEAVVTSRADLPELDGARFWDEVLEPLLQASGQPRVSVVLVAGLSWSLWQRELTGPLGEHFEIGSRVLLAPLPAASEASLKRAVGGMRWRPEAAGWDWDELLGRLRPELGLRTRGPLPRWLSDLAQAGLVKAVGSSRTRSLVAIDLMAGCPGGVPLAEHARRRGLLTAALGRLARSGRRDELVLLWGVSGAVGCTTAPGAALGGPALAPRCLLRPADDEEGAVALHVRAEQLDFAPAGAGQALLASGRGRLVPAAAEAVMADGGLAVDELAVPFATLTPWPKGERTRLQIGSLAVADWLTAGEPAELALYVTLVSGALAEVATLETDLPGVAPLEATLDLGEPRRLALSFVPELAPGERRREVVIEVSCQVGRRRVRRRALCTVLRPPEPAAGPTAVAAEELSTGE